MIDKEIIKKEIKDKPGIIPKPIELGSDSKPIIIEIDPVKQKETDQNLLTGLKLLKKSESGVPTYIPRKFIDQIYFQDNGTLWAYINNIWYKYIHD